MEEGDDAQHERADVGGPVTGHMPDAAVLGRQRRRMRSDGEDRSDEEEPGQSGGVHAASVLVRRVSEVIGRVRGSLNRPRVVYDDWPERWTVPPREQDRSVRLL